jgi:tripartite-type tricarboxylate transporter receptor subunit TctC
MTSLRLLTGLCGWLLALTLHAQTYPQKPVRIIVPYAAGQGTDIAARYLADELAKAINQAFVIDNRPGAGGNIGSQLAAKSPADGYTLIVGTNATHAANAFLYANPGFDPQADFEPIAMLGILPLVYVTQPGNPVSSIPELTSAAQARPERLSVAISTTTCRMAHELYKSRGQTSLFPVDFKGSTQSITALLGGHVDYMVDTVASLRSHINSGQLKALGVTSAKSSRMLPGVKSLAEQGIMGYELVGWTVLFAPKGVPGEVSQVLSAATAKVLARSEVQDKLMQIGIEPLFKSGPELKAFVDAEKDKWGRLIVTAKIQPN